jgi:hypothetical protein
MPVGALAGFAAAFLFFSQQGFLYGLLTWFATGFLTVALNALSGLNALDGLRSWLGLIAIVAGVAVWFSWI